MQPNNYFANQNPDKIITQYYQRFYKDRKNTINLGRFFDSNNQQSSVDGQSLVFQMNYQQNLNLNHKKQAEIHKSKQTMQNDIRTHSKDNEFQDGNIKVKSKTEKHNIPTKNITFNLQAQTIHVNIPNKSLKSSSKRSQFKVQNFDHFPHQNTRIKNKSNKNYDRKQHFFSIIDYSKTVDFQNICNPQSQKTSKDKSAEKQQKQCQKQDNQFSLQNFSHIQLHKNKNQMNSEKNSANKRVMVDIIKRRNPSPSPKLLSHSLLMDMQRSRKQLGEKQCSNKRSNQKREGIFKQFKPKVQLKRRPSTGSPLKKNRNLVVSNSFHPHQRYNAHSIQGNSRPKSTNDKDHHFSNTISNFESLDFNKFNNMQDQSHSRANSYKVQNYKTLSINTRQIHLLKYIDMSDSQKLNDLFGTSKMMEKRNLKNFVHLEFHKGHYPFKDSKQSQVLKDKARKRLSLNDVSKEYQFLPWDSTQKEEQFIENNEIIERQISLIHHEQENPCLALKTIKRK